MSIFQLAAIFLFQLRNLLSAVQPRPSAAYGMTPDSCCLLWPPAAPMPAKEQQQAVTSHNTHTCPRATEAYLERDYSDCKLYGGASVWGIAIGGELE